MISERLSTEAQPLPLSRAVECGAWIPSELRAQGLEGA